MGVLLLVLLVIAQCVTVRPIPRNATTILVGLKADLPEKGLVCGSPERTALIRSMLNNVVNVADFRGYRVDTGFIGETQIFVANHEIGGPGAAFIVEELIAWGARTIVRLGSSDAPSQNRSSQELETVFIIKAESAPVGLMRDYGWPPDVWTRPVAADANVAAALIAAGNQQGKVKAILSNGYAIDGYYAMNFPQFSYNASRVQEVVQEQERVVGQSLHIDREMECGAVLLIASLRDGVAAGCVLQVVTKGNNEHEDPATTGVAIVLTALQKL